MMAFSRRDKNRILVGLSGWVSAFALMIMVVICCTRPLSVRAYVSGPAGSTASTLFRPPQQQQQFVLLSHLPSTTARYSSYNSRRCRVVLESSWNHQQQQHNDDGELDSLTASGSTESIRTTRRTRKSLSHRLHSLASRSKRWMQHLHQWQQRRRRSLLTAAALAFSVLLVSSSPVNFPAPQPAVSPSAAAVEHMVLVQRQHQPQAQQQLPQHHQHAASWIARGGAGAGIFKSSSKDMPPEERALQHMEQAVEQGVARAGRRTKKTLQAAFRDLRKYMAGPKSDTLLLLLATALITPLCQGVGISPILGFLASGMLMGPNGAGWISGIHTTETLAELGIVFFLFEMGIELSFERLKSMRRDVFGLGFTQFMGTAAAVAAVGKIVGLPANALVVLGGGLALSSSAFVLQLLKAKNQLATRFGKAAFGVLLFQDLAVVPLLVVTPILAGGGQGLAKAVFSAVVKAGMALTGIGMAGRFLLNPLFKTVAAAQSQEAFLGVILLTVLSMSFMTEGLGLSNTLGAFLAGVLLSETKYRYQVEADIAPFRGILLGLFFVTVGFEIDLKLIASNLPLVGSLVVGIMAVKAMVTTAASLAFGLSLSTSQQTGLILSQGGEFAFVAFGLARSLGILDPFTTKLMLTSVSLTMALTPFMSSVGGKIAKRLEENSDFSHYLGQDQDANEIKESDDFAVVVGYGSVGKVVCDLFDRKFIKYVGLEIDPAKAIQARNIGLPVFYGDIGRQEVAEAFNVGKAKAVIVCVADKAQTNRIVIALRRWYPELKIFSRAADADHASRLQNTLNVAAMVPILPEDNLLLTLPFGGAVMKSLGVPSEEVNAIVESRRKEVLMARGMDKEEEELALLQLGIGGKRANSTETQKSKSMGGNSTMASEEEWDSDESRLEAAIERRKQTEEKSPFVAHVIEEICPGSADEPCEAPDTVELVQASAAVALKLNATIIEERLPEVLAVEDE